MKKEKQGSHLLRKGRFSERGHYYFLTTGTAGRMPIFENGEAARIVLTSLFWLEKNGRIGLLTAVVMPDHLHFVADLQTGSLTELMKSLKGFTSRQINILLNRKGRIWEPQYYDHAIRNDEVLEEVVLYCLHNPVRKGLVKDFHAYPHWYCRWKM